LGLQSKFWASLLETKEEREKGMEGGREKEKRRVRK
jgi:hypothetical protein